MDKGWQKTFDLMKEKDPVAAKLLTWIYATETNTPMAPSVLMTFADDNPDWPRLHVFRARIEEGIAASGMAPHETAQWFRRNPPQSYEGLKACMSALHALDDKAEMKRVMARFWRDAVLDRPETAAAAAQYRAYLTPADHAARFDILIWDGRYSEAEALLAFLGPKTRAEGEARIALGRGKNKGPRLLAALPAETRNKEGVIFEHLRSYRRAGEDDKAFALLEGAVKNSLRHPDKWWAEQNILARRAMESGDFRKAYRLISAHQMKGGIEYAQAEWMLGWIELRHLGLPDDALKRFSNLYFHVQSAISKSRAAYWASRAAKALQKKEVAETWGQRAARYLSTYYGQLSYHDMRGAAKQADIGEVAPPLEATKLFDKRDVVRAVRLLRRTGLDSCITPFLAKIVSLAKTNDDYHLAARLAREVGHDQYAVQANKDIQQTLGSWLLKDGYPVLRNTPGRPEKALLHAIVYRESMFNTTAVSAAGARGLMQLMPATAKAVSKKEKTRFSADRLTADPGYNVKIGASYLSSLLEKYNGNAPLAIAAYNAGPTNVAKWREAFGTPKKKDVDIIDWIEMIPNYETRNYVQRVMESWYMYRLKFHQTPMTVKDFD